MRVAVIGGGIAGLAAAASLAENADVTLIEWETALGYHASGRSAAMFEENYGNDVVRQLNAASRPVHEAVGVLSPRGLICAAFPEDDALFDKDIEGLGLREISVEAARERVPILAEGLVRAGVFEEAFDLDTDRLMQHYARSVRALGGAVLTGCGVTGLSRGTCWIVETSDGVIEADIIVNAAGAWADEVAGLAGAKPVGLQPFRRSMARLPAPGGHDVRGWPMLMGPGERWYAKPDAGAWLVSPAEEDPVAPMDAWADDMVLAEGIARYQPYVTAPVDRVEGNWAGLRTFALDRALVIGADPQVDGFFWMAGQGGYGFQTAPAAGALLADLVFGRAPALSVHVGDAVSPARF